MKILQINLNHCRTAHDLLLIAAAENEADLVLVSEPYKIPNEWSADLSNRAAIWVTSRGASTSAVVKCVARHTGFVITLYEDVYVVSVYASPNDKLYEFEAFLLELAIAIKPFNRKNQGVIIAGDFNARSPLWGSDSWCNRGRALHDFCTSSNFFPVITSGGNTCERGRGSKIDILICNSTAIASLKDTVVLDEYTASDHKYLLHFFQETYRMHNQLRRPDSEIPNKCKVSDRKFLELFLDKYSNSRFSRLICDNSVADVDKFITDVSRIVKKSTKIVNTANHMHPPVSWWSEEIAQKRKIVLGIRRRLTRAKSKQKSYEITVLLNEFRKCKSDLNLSIKKAKKESWLNLLQEVNSDVWGRPYKSVVRLVKNKTSPEILSAQEIKEVVHKLFILEKDRHLVPDPPLDEWADATERDVEDTQITEADVLIAVSKIASKKAPGPDGVSSFAAKKIGVESSKWLTYIFNICMSNGYWPATWKVGRLVLIPKGKPALGSVDKAYRPLSIISCLAKIFEHVMKDKLLGVLLKYDLAPNQYGFRKGRSTIDAMRNVTNLWQRARSEGRHCLLILLDVRNAFNSLRWSSIISCMRKRGFPRKLVTLTADYLNNRWILYEGKDMDSRFQVFGGVPQGSVIGPLLWNLVYDDLLRSRTRRDVHLIGYADDVGIVIIEEDLDKMSIIAEATVDDMSRWYRNEGLELAHQKTEAILLTGSRVPRGIQFRCGEHNVRTVREARYLGVIFEKNSVFKTHISTACDKALRYANALALLMPNRAGADNLPRKLYYKVIESVILYGAPIWATGLKNKGNLRILMNTQRTGLLRVAQAYRTVSTDSLCVLTGQIPLHLLAKERMLLYDKKKSEDREIDADAKKILRDDTLQSWQQLWDSSKKGRWTHKLIPRIEAWIDWGPSILNFYVTQVLTGHGCFGSFLKKIAKQDSDLCWFCPGKVDNPEHFLFECDRWAADRITLNTLLKETFSIENFMNFVGKIKTRRHVIDFIVKCLKEKELFERKLHRSIVARVGQ